MSIKARNLVFFLSVLLVSFALSSAQSEEEGDLQIQLQQCQRQCDRSYEGQQVWQCKQQCQERYQEEQRQRRADSFDDVNYRQGGTQEDDERCKQDCRQQPHYDQGMRSRCEQQCEQQQQQQHRLQQCQQQCEQSYEGQQKQLCKHRCQQRYQEQQRRQHQGQDNFDTEKLEQCQRQCRRRSYQGGEQHQQEQERQCEQQCQRRQGQGSTEEIDDQHHGNPYVFRQESIKHRYRSEQGSIRILENFLKKSHMHLGIANYRLEFLEANPNTFLVPSHYDADQVVFVMRGEATITQIRQNQDRESHNIRQGDIIKIPAGTVVYLINRSNNQNLQLANLLNPVSTPGQFQTFYTSGGNQPESYYRAFSNDILEAALNTRREELDRLFGQQRQGIMVRASQEQIRSMSHSSSSSERTTVSWPFNAGESRTVVKNLFNQRPTFANNHGQLYMTEPDEDLNIRVTYMNITQGSMLAPSFNSRSTKIAIIRNGRGRLEMVCPHLSQQGQQRRQENDQEEGGRRYQLVQSEISKNTVFIAPPGHPAALVAEGNENLEVVSFEINAKNNRKEMLAGKNNIVSKMEREAQELAFGVPSKFVEQVFGGNKQQDQVFVRGPQQQQREEGSRRPFESILEFVGF